MPILLISLCTVTLTVQQALKKQYSLRCSGGNYFFSALVSFFALLFFLLIPGKISLGTDILPYSAEFAAMFALATVFSVMALTIGSLAITSLVLSYSLIIPTLYGILFLNEKITPLKCGGILLLLVSLFLVRKQRMRIKQVNQP